MILILKQDNLGYMGCSSLVAYHITNWFNRSCTLALPRPGRENNVLYINESQNECQKSCTTNPKVLMHFFASKFWNFGSTSLEAQFGQILGELGHTKGLQNYKSLKLKKIKSFNSLWGRVSNLF